MASNKPAGTYTLQFWAGKTGYTGSATVTRTIVVPPSALPDLTVTAVTGANASVGGAMSLSATIRNLGSGASTGPTIQFYLATAQDFFGTEYPVCNLIVGTYAAGASRLEQTSCLVPSSVPAGNYYVLALVDGPGAISETSENNNLGSSISQYAINAGTLTISNITPAGPTTVNPGGSATHSITVQDNTGAAVSGATVNVIDPAGPVDGIATTNGSGVAT